jgi:hypothetical protein
MYLTGLVLIEIIRAMKNAPAHKKRSFRKLTAIVMMAVYLLIVLSPLAPFAMYSKTVAHAVTGECSGDCSICGCSVESRANHSCCCAKKKLQDKLSAGVQKPAAAKRSCCAESKPAAPKKECCAASKPVALKKDCCAKSGQHSHDENGQALSQKPQPSKNETVYKCGCPCGKNLLFALAPVHLNQCRTFTLIDWCPRRHAPSISPSHIA